MRAILLFTRDLRVADHPALAAAGREAEYVVPLFVIDPDLVPRSSNRSRFLLQALVDLDRSLERMGGGLVIRRGDPVVQVVRLAAGSACEAVFLTHDVSGFAARREQALAQALGSAGIALRLMPGNSVVPPGAVAPAGRTAYRMFTPYLRAWGRAARRPVVATPRWLRVPPGVDPGPRPDPTSVSPDADDLAPGGERPGRRRMHAFLRSSLAGYAADRNTLDVPATSRLSPYLRFGCISANELASLADVPGGEAFVRQLTWRDFFAQLLDDNPSLTWRNLREPVDRPEPPGDPDEVLRAWCEGRTGAPLVDAGMRQLAREGWMHNRARLVAASFLTRRLGIGWQEGAAHFMRLLVDGDPANNAGNWQWAAGTGTDPRRARTLNPVRQARRFDPTGAYVRCYVEELSDVGAPDVFAPWKVPGLLERTGYPPPLVEPST